MIQLELLFHLIDEFPGGASQGALEESIGVKSGTLRTTLGRLIAHKLVKRRKVPVVRDIGVSGPKSIWIYSATLQRVQD